MNRLRLHIARFVTLLVALQILNSGFFVQDFEQLSDSGSSIYDNNVINSVVEYVSEVVLQKVNAVPESNNRENKDLQAQKHFTVKLVEVKQPKIEFPTLVQLSETTTLLHNPYCNSFFAEINPPPPRA